MSMLEAEDEYEKEQNLITQSFNVPKEQSSSVSLKDNKSFKF